MTGDEMLDICRPIEGWMYDDELLWLYEQAKHAPLIVEVGVWKGKSTMALALGTPDVVYAIDHWHGSPEELASYHAVCQDEAGRREVFLAAMRNLHPVIDSGQCVPIPLSSERAAELLGPMLRRAGGAGMIFLDGGHDYESLTRDIYIWRTLLAEGGLFCGHDHKPDFPGVGRATSELLGQVDLGPGSIWSKRL
jgi:hypothetical protein